MNQLQAKTLCKAINRRLRKHNAFTGGGPGRVDWSTWCLTYPHLAREFNRAASVLAGKAGRYLPIAIL